MDQKPGDAKPSIFQRVIAGVVAIFALLQLSTFIVEYLAVRYDKLMLDNFPHLFLDTSNAGTVEIVDTIFWGGSVIIAITISYWINDKTLSILKRKAKK